MGLPPKYLLWFKLRCDSLWDSEFDREKYVVAPGREKPALSKRSCRDSLEQIQCGLLVVASGVHDKFRTLPLVPSAAPDVDDRPIGQFGKNARWKEEALLRSRRSIVEQGT